MPEVKHIFYRPLAHHTGVWNTVFLPLFIAGFLMLLDHYCIQGVFALPTFLLVLLVFLGMRLPAKIVGLWAIFFAGVITLVTLLKIDGTVTNPAYRPVIRPLIFMAGSIGTIALAGFRQKLQSGHEALFRVISAFPVAVMISDISGTILLVNDKARRVLRDHLKYSRPAFFDTFLAGGDPSKSIAEYISYFDPRRTETVNRVLRTRSEPALLLHASLTTVVVEGRRYAITMIEKTGPAADDSGAFVHGEQSREVSRV